MTVKFDELYSTFSLTQQYQHAKLFKIMKKELGDLSPKKILDIGCGDGKQTIFVAKLYPGAEVVGIDVSDKLIEQAEKQKSSLGIRNVRFELVDYFDFDEGGFDVAYSNNTFHWFGERAAEGYRKLRDHLVFGGFFFVHQGGRWSYIALRCLMEEMLKEKGINPPQYPLFYPTRRKMEELLENWFSVFQVKKEVEHEIESRQVYIDFTYAGGLPYINLLPPEEREKFRIEFVRRCIEEEVPAFPVRLYIWGRNTPDLEYVFYEKASSAPSHVVGDVERLLKEADEEFVPPLSLRVSSVQSEFKSSGPGDVSSYLKALLGQGLVVAKEPSGSVVGFLSFVRDFLFSGKRWVYVSTIIVRRVSRGLGVAGNLYRELFSRFPDVPVLTRTWSGNDVHMKVLKKLGFEEIKRIPGHRGKGIDTIYMAKVW